MLVILFCMAAGFLAHKLGYLGGQTDQKLCRLLLGIIVPCLILDSVSAGDTLPSTGEILSVLKVAIVYYGLGFFSAALVPRLLGGTAKQQGVWRYSLVFSNMAFIGYPVSVALFGQEALFYAVILVLPFNLLSYSLGPLMLAGQAKFRWQQLLSPCIVTIGRFSAGRFAFWADIYFTPAVGSGGLSASDPSHYAVAAPEVDRYRHASGV